MNLPTAQTAATARAGTSGNNREHFSNSQSARTTSPRTSGPPHSTKPTYKRPNGLSVEQQNAIDLLTLGHTDISVARTIGVSRTTVTKWRLYDPLFKRTLAGRRARLWQGAHDGIRAQLPGALGAIRRQMLYSPNPGRFALNFIRAAGLVGTPTKPALAYPSFDEPDDLQELLNHEVRRRRPPDRQYDPVTQAERDAMCDHLIAIAEGTAEPAAEEPHAETT